MFDASSTVTVVLSFVIAALAKVIGPRSVLHSLVKVLSTSTRLTAMFPASGNPPITLTVSEIISGQAPDLIHGRQFASLAAKSGTLEQK